MRATAPQTIAGTGAVGHPVCPLRERPFQPRPAVSVQHGGKYRQRQRVGAGGADDAVLQVGGAQRRHLECQRHIRLLRLRLDLDPTHTDLGRLQPRLAHRNGTGGNRTIGLLHPLAYLRHIHVAGHDHGGIGRHIPAVMEITHIVGGHGLQVVHPAHDRATVGRRQECDRGQFLIQPGPRTVVGTQATLLLDHFDFPLEFVIGPLVFRKTVGLELHHIAQTRRRYLLVIAGVVARGKGVLAAPEFGNPARKLTRCDAGRSLEHHVFEHMGHARSTIHFIHRARPYPHHVHHGRRATFGPDDDLHAIGQREPGDRLHSGVRCLVGTGQQGLGLGL